MMKAIKEMCSTDIRFGRSKLLQSCSNVTVKLEREPTVTACLAGRDDQEVLYTEFVHATQQHTSRATICWSLQMQPPTLSHLSFSPGRPNKLHFYRN